MPTALTPAQLRAINTFVDTEVMNGRRRVVPQWDAIAVKKTQALATGTYGWMNDIPIIGQREIGGYRTSGVGALSFQLTSKFYGQGLRIPARDIRDDLVGVYQDLAGKLGQRMEQFPQDMLFNLFQEGDQTTYLSESILAHDGLAFFHDSHLTDGRTSGGGTYDNNLTGTALTKANFEVALAAIMNFPDSQGKRLNQYVTHLIVSPSQSVAAADIIYASLISTGGTNMSSNEGLVARGLPPIKLVVCPELGADTTTWYLTCMGQGRAPMVWQETTPMATTMYADPHDSNMRNDDEVEWLAKGESAFMFGDPRCAIRCIT